MSEVKYTGVQEVVTLLDRLPESTFEAVKQVFKDAVLNTQQKVVQRFVAGPLHNRTSRASRSITTQLSGNTLATLKASVYSGPVAGSLVEYVPVHEFGATITAKKAYAMVPGGPYLNIPLPANLTASGVQRQTAGQVFQAGGYLKRSGRNNWVVMSVKNKPMFTLKKSVTIPARLGFFDTANGEISRITDRLSSMLPAEWRKI